MEPNNDTVPVDAILWRGFVFPGHEACRLFSLNSEWHLEGTAVFSYELQTCRLDYQIICDATWHTLFAKVAGWLDTAVVDIQIQTDPTGRWWLNDVEQSEVRDCIDIDLNFSPSTNLLPIRRLSLAVGEEVQLRAAWLRFPSFKLEPLSQSYRRLDEQAYRYESAGGQFITELKVNHSGFVIDYPGIWKAESGSE